MQMLQTTAFLEIFQGKKQVFKVATKIFRLKNLSQNPTFFLQSAIVTPIIYIRFSTFFGQFCPPSTKLYK